MMSLIQATSEAIPTLTSVVPQNWFDVIMQNPGAWLCWLIPIVGAILMLPIAKVLPKFRDYAPVLFAGLAVIATMSMLPGLWALHPTNDYQIGTWINLPNGAPFSIGVLVDPLSIVIANVVAFISFLIIVYSVGYMHGDEHLTRYWFLFLFFIGNMLLLVLSDNLIQTLIGWEGVGMCSYGLIGYYYRDNKERWLGGPLPTKMFPPSHAGMKAFVVTGIGDVFLLGAIFIIYNFAGTLNYMQLIESAPIWMTSIAAVPGLLSLTALLFLGGPIGKSAQFPLNEWLPEAMAGPTSVSALIHAATMVKAGVYLVARIAPAFYLGRYVADLPEAQMFFYTIAAVGAFTAFLAATQALVALELKKVLAYSTVSQIGFMMLGLGVSGFTEANFLPGLTAGIFHLVSHALFKAALFLCAGSVIHGVETIYMNNMGNLGKEMPFTKVLMLLATLSLAGIPPFSGFWSKDAVFVASLAAGGEFGTILYLTAVITALITLVYSARYIYMVFHGEKSKFIQELEHHGHHLHESPKIMTWPIAILVVIMIALSVFGLIGFFVPSWSPELYLEHQMELTLEGIGVMRVFEENHLEFIKPHISDVTKLTAIGSSAILIAIGSSIIYIFWFKRKVNSWEFVSKSAILRPIHSFLWNRWYLNDLYYAVFVSGTLMLKQFIYEHFEVKIMTPLSDNVAKIFQSFSSTLYSFFEEKIMLGYVNDSAPKLIFGIGSRLKQIQTGMLRINLIYMVFLLLVLLIGMSLLGGI